MIECIRNVAIIAHVDHGKTTIVDKLLAASGTLDRKEIGNERVMDSNDQERERGITILAKNTGLNWNDYQINLVDTPGHADFGGEVERILSMVDAVLLVVDAAEGPMPQTRFVTQKAFAQGLKPIVIVNKIDKIGADPYGVIDKVFDLFDQLGATDDQLDFPIIYCSAINGLSGPEIDQVTESMEPVLQTIVKHCPAPNVDLQGPLQLQISALDYNPFQGVIGVGRIHRGTLVPNQQVTIVGIGGERRSGKVLQIFGYLGLDRIEKKSATAGDVICITGINSLSISDTVCSTDAPEGLPPLSVDEPTISMTFQVNDSPFSGLDGKYVTSRNIKDRLDRELIYNVALRVEPSGSPDKFVVSGRGELHLSVLIESMRREGFELGVSRPEVIIREHDGVLEEPFEYLVLDIEDQYQGVIMEAIGCRKGTMKNMAPNGQGRVRLEYIVSSRSLVGFRSQFLAMTSGTGVMSFVFDHYGPIEKGDLGNRINGVLVSMIDGVSTTYSLFGLQDRGRLVIAPGTPIYEGMIIGIHNRDNDLPVNPVKGKQLTNIRAAGTDDALVLTPPIKMTLESALEFIDDDELVEVTPNNIRLRKKLLKESDRKKASRAKAAS